MNKLILLSINVNNKSFFLPLRQLSLRLGFLVRVCLLSFSSLSLLVLLLILLFVFLFLGGNGSFLSLGLSFLLLGHAVGLLLLFVSFSLSFFHSEIISVFVVEVESHVISILSVSVVARGDTVDLVIKDVVVKAKGSSVGLADMQGAVLGSVDLVHLIVSTFHELGSDSELSVLTQHAQ